jgi:hypothetical protein
MPSFVDRPALIEEFRGKTVAIVGSGPGALDNAPGFIDSYDIVVRVNNYGTSKMRPPNGQNWSGLGERCDVFYSFFGGSILKKADELRADGVRLCLAKCPNAKAIDSEWHRKNNKPRGVDFRYIYEARRDWWPTPVYVPSVEEFLASFDILGQHIPSTGFSAVLLIRSLEPRSIYMTGFDFFSSKIHNVADPWRPGSPDDPIGHAPERERAWLRANQQGITFDRRLAEIMATE